MYTIDERDRVVELKDFPQSSVGAPTPVIVSNEFTTVAAFYLENAPADWDGARIRIVTQESEGESIAVVRFHLCYAHYFGAPNDEAFSGHPLYKCGLHLYGAFE